MKCVLHADGSSICDNADVVVPWWSFTKTLMAALALTLVRDGRLALDDPLPSEAFSLREVLLHRAGLADYGALPAYHAAVAANENAWPVDDMLARVAPLHAGGRRGTFNYSNVGYTLLRRQIEQLTGQSLGEAMRDRLGQPLGVAGPVIAEARSDSTYDPRWVYHGLAIGPLRDATALLQGLLTSDLLPRHLRDAMCEGMPVGDAGPDRPWRHASYGLGLMTGITRGGLHVAGHTGGGPGSTIAVYHLAAASRTAAVFFRSPHVADVERAVFALDAGG